MRSLLGDQQYRDGIARHLPPGVDYVEKTGWQSRLVHDCGVLTGPSGRIALAVLTEGYPEPYPAHELMGSIWRARGKSRYPGMIHPVFPHMNRKMMDNRTHCGAPSRDAANGRESVCH